MGQKTANMEQILRDETARLLARATDTYKLDVNVLIPRVRATLEKYLLRDQPAAPLPEIKQFFDSLKADELCLAVACERGDEAAWNDLIERYRATVLSAARSASASEAEAEELAQSVWAELYGLRANADGRPSGKLAYYSGCGSLGGWLRAVVAQLAVDRHRKVARLVQTEEDADLDYLSREHGHSEDAFKVTASPDPERVFASREIAQALHAALERVIGELAAEDRLLIKLYYFDNLRLREAGAVLGVHEATASRRLSRLHSEVRKRVENILIADHGWTTQEMTRALTEAAAHLEIDLRRVLAEQEQ